MRMAFALAGLLGGGAWIAAYVVDRVSPGALVDQLTWGGAALLGIAVLGMGAGLVSRSAVWLRLLVAVCFLALVASVLVVLRQSGDDLVVDALVGALAVVFATVAAVVRRPPSADAPGHRAGRSHAR